MEKQLETALAELINTTLSGADTAKDFLVAQAPDAIQQLLMWHGVFNFIIFIFAIITPIVCCVIIAKTISYFLRKDSDGRYVISCSADREIPICIISLIMGTISVVSFVAMINFTWLQIWIAPKVWLLEYAASLVK